MKNTNSDAEGERPSPRTGHSSILFNDQLYIFGGEDLKGNTNDFFTYQIQWNVFGKVEQGGNIPSPRSFHSSCFIPENTENGQHPMMLIFGGYTDQGFSNELYFFDLVDMKWNKPISISSEFDTP